MVPQFYSCNFAGECERDDNSDETLDQCQEHCQSMPNRDVVNIIHGYAADPSGLAPSNAVRIVRDITGITVPRDVSQAVLGDIGSFELYSMLFVPEIRPWVLAQHGVARLAMVQNMMLPIFDITTNQLTTAPSISLMLVEYHEGVAVADSILMMLGLPHNTPQGVWKEHLRNLLETFASEEEDLTITGTQDAFTVVLKAPYTYREALTVSKLFARDGRLVYAVVKEGVLINDQ